MVDMYCRFRIVSVVVCMGVVLIVLVMVLCFLCGRLQVNVWNQNKTVETLVERCQYLDGSMDQLDGRVSELERSVSSLEYVTRGRFASENQ